LTGTYSQPTFKEASQGKFDIYSGKRGSPENTGDELIAVHPIVRTNPVTNWKSLFAIGVHFTKFDGLTLEENNLLKDHLHNLLVGSHDIQVRFKWTKNDVAIWDNRSTYHTAAKRLAYCGNLHYNLNLFLDHIALHSSDTVNVSFISSSHWATSLKLAIVVTISLLSRSSNLSIGPVRAYPSSKHLIQGYRKLNR
jgi:hypothetical protein